MKVKSIVVAYKAQMNPQMGGAVDILGSFENLIQPMFPIPMRHMSIVVTIEEIVKPTKFEVRINGVNDDLITKGEFIPMVDPFGVGKKILDLDNILIKDRGRYTIDILEKTADDKLKFISSHTLFIADYPPQRQFTPDMVEKILNTEDVIKVVKTEFTPVDLGKAIKIQHNLDKNAPIEEGYMTIPKGDKITVEGKEYDLMGLRRQIEWMFGNPLPKPEEKKSEEASKEEIKQ